MRHPAGVSPGPSTKELTAQADACYGTTKVDAIHGTAKAGVQQKQYVCCSINGNARVSFPEDARFDAIVERHNRNPTIDRAWLPKALEAYKKAESAGYSLSQYAEYYPTWGDQVLMSQICNPGVKGAKRRGTNTRYDSWNQFGQPNRKAR